MARPVESYRGARRNALRDGKDTNIRQWRLARYDALKVKNGSRRQAVHPSYTLAMQEKN